MVCGGEEDGMIHRAKHLVQSGPRCLKAYSIIDTRPVPLIGLLVDPTW